MKYLLFFSLLSILYCTVYSICSVCYLPRKTGPCRGYLRRFYYDYKTRSCKFFIYGGCKGNENNFKTLEECNRKCHANTVDICHLPRKPGPCRGSLKRYHYDYKTGRCNEFVYGGCKGNENNFRSMRRCQFRCSNYQGNICHLPKKSGPCRAYIVRYFYDKKTISCKRFIYGGCRSNPNNFKSLNECEKYCNVEPRSKICYLPRKTGPCRGYLRRFYYDHKSSSCKFFIYGGCKGNENNFETLTKCNKKCHANTVDICHLPKKTGPCEGSMKKYYYDHKTGRCNEFIYGGCKGNGNNFRSIRECQFRCSKYQGNICHLPKTPGLCRAYFVRYYYDKKTQSCNKFIYGGCSGNPNNFKTLHECESYCRPDIDPCRLPYEVGMCKAIIPRYYFNYVTGKCSTFNYGGCNGNSNNFKSLAECRKACLHSEDICVLPMVKGMCLAYFPRYYYNSKSQKCEKFIYGGCGGNRNNFKTLNECQDECKNRC